MFQIRQGVFKVKIILILGLVFSGWQAFGVIEFEDSQKEGCFYMGLAGVKNFWHELFRADLRQRVESLAISAGGHEYINLDDLTPRPSFTKPHRLQLLQAIKDGGFYGWRQYESNRSLDLLRMEYLEQFLFKTLEYFNKPTDFYDTLTPEMGDYMFGGRSHCQPLTRRTAEGKEVTREMRWWFNDNIKPLLEKVLFLESLEYGEYEPY